MLMDSSFSFASVTVRADNNLYVYMYANYIVIIAKLNYAAAWCHSMNYYNFSSLTFTWEQCCEQY